MDLNDWISNGIAGVALLLSVYAVIRQRPLIAMERKLKQQQLEQGESAAVEAKKADIGARIVQVGRTNHRVKVFNKGKAPARNVRIEFPAGDDLVPESEIRSKFPMEILEPHASVDLLAIVVMATPLKHTAVVKWADDHSEENARTVYMTV